MYCPKCAKENPEGQRFCPSCGANLQNVAQAIEGQFSPFGNFASIAKLGGNLATLIYSLLIIAIGVVFTVVGSKIFDLKILTTIGTLISLLGVGLIGLKGVLMIVGQAGLLEESDRQSPSALAAAAERRIKKEEKRLSAKQQQALPTGQPISVTEHTTRRLEAEVFEKPRTTQPH